MIELSGGHAASPWQMQMGAREPQVVDADRRVVCSVALMDNAVLIAASPEMLELLIRVFEHEEDFTAELVAHAHNVIAKATAPTTKQPTTFYPRDGR